MADMIVDGANAILVFKNTDITAEEVKEMKRAGAIIISDANGSKQTSTADLDTITIEIPFTGLNSYYEQLITPAYDIAGVPLASGQIVSGGSTGQALLLGGGWNNAYIVANNNITTFKAYDYEELKLILLFCKQIPNSPLNELNASQVDIKYRINQSDNFLSKAQGIMNLYSINMPKEEILKASNLFSDVTTLAKKWDLADKETKATISTSVAGDETQTPKDDGEDVSSEPNDSGNNSQE